jgi:hypothetical protein
MRHSFSSRRETWPGHEYGRRWAPAEVEAGAVTARLLGYDPARAGDVFTFGGSATTLYATRISLEKACRRWDSRKRRPRAGAHAERGASC